MEEETREQLQSLVTSGRLSINIQNIRIIPEDPDKGIRAQMLEKSKNAMLCIIGFRSESLKPKGSEIFLGYEGLGPVIFVNSSSEKDIE
jgi:hypothetical protein